MKFLLTISIIMLFNISIFCQKQSTEDQNTQALQKKDLLGIGYQVGGATLIGVDYERRFHDYIGIHFGGGLNGYNAGINIHLSPKPHSNYVSLSYEDGGFGLINLASVKYGGLFGFGKTKTFGIYYNIGLAAITSIDSELEDKLFKDTDAQTLCFILDLVLDSECKLHNKI